MYNFDNAINKFRENVLKRDYGLLSKCTANCTYCPRLCVLIDTLGEINKRIINVQTQNLKLFKVCVIEECVTYFPIVYSVVKLAIVLIIVIIPRAHVVHLISISLC